MMNEPTLEKLRAMRLEGRACSVAVLEKLEEMATFLVAEGEMAKSSMMSTSTRASRVSMRT